MRIVDVVIPCWKQARFLPDAITSVFRQTYPYWRLTVVPGDEESAAVAGQCLAFAPRPSHVWKTAIAAHGLADARNSGITNPTWSAPMPWGCPDLIAPLDADDRFGATYLEETVLAMGDAEFGIVSTDMQHMDAAGNILPGGWSLPKWNPETIHEYNQLTYASLYTAKLWRAVGGYDPAASHEDWDFWIRCSAQRPQVRHVYGRMLLYRLHTEQSLIAPLYGSGSVTKAIITLLHPERWDDASMARARDLVRGMPEAGKQMLISRRRMFPKNGGLRMLCEVAGVPAEETLR